jgi:hypothetical protein
MSSIANAGKWDRLWKIEEGCDCDGHEQGWKLQMGMGICMGSERGKEGWKFFSSKDHPIIHT